MATEPFLSSVKALAERNLALVELITAADQLQAADDAALAAQLYALWIGVNPGDPHLPVAYYNRAALLINAGDAAAAKIDLERALALNPDFFPAYVGLGNAHESLGAIRESLAQWSALSARLGGVTRPALDYKLTALKQSARILAANHRSAEAETVLRASLELDPAQADIVQSFLGMRLAQCEWPIVAPWRNVTRGTLMTGIGPLSMTVYSDDPLLQLASAWNYARPCLDELPVPFERNRRPVAADFQPRRRRIGYVSSDLRNHAVGALMAEFFGLHDRGEFEVFAYYCGPTGEDALQARIRPQIEHWVDIRALDDDAAARRIVADGIDILVDLNGHTKEARTGLFFRRPAPVIVNWLGYPGSMGTPCHHYIIADPWIIPPEHELYYSEKVVRLPCYQPNDRKRAVAPHRPTRAEAGLPEDATVFCCFNDVHKILRFTFERWMTILRRVPGSVLWLLGGSDVANRNLLGFAARAGVAPERIVFADVVPHPDHLARIPLADLFLDTAPYGAHVTAADVLWMGVPILTLSGRGFASRVCGSLCRAAGLPELVCATPEDYVERAVALGADRGELRRLSARLGAGRESCALFAVDTLVTRIEALYRQMWRDFLGGNLPQPDIANLDVYLEVGCALDHEDTELLAADDYHAQYVARMACRHRAYPVAEDRRLWTHSAIARWIDDDGSARGQIHPFPLSAAG
jgi:predicted O-linked N-acetylglucosamine transferase (SPINDLY family)